MPACYSSGRDGTRPSKTTAAIAADTRAASRAGDLWRIEFHLDQLGCRQSSGLGQRRCLKPAALPEISGRDGTRPSKTTAAIAANARAAGRAGLCGVSEGLPQVHVQRAFAFLVGADAEKYRAQEGVHAQ